MVEEEKKGMSLGEGGNYIVYLRMSTAPATEASKMLGYEIETIIAVEHTDKEV